MAISHARDLGRPFMNLIRVKTIPILQQLHLEERLLRTSSDNWCIINDGTDTSTIVMGLSGKPSELIELESVLQDRIPVIKRFSGGGTVIVDDGTVFVSFICNKGVIPGLKSEPKAIMSWSGQFYGEALCSTDDFRLHENDYAFGNRKFGGNAQSITKDRWIHHTSFLWDYDIKNMDYLKLPMRAPNYRSARDHIDFLCPMKEFLKSRSGFIEKTIGSIGNYFVVRPVRFDDIADSSYSDTTTTRTTTTTYPRTTRLLTKQELEAAFAASQLENFPERGERVLQS